MLQEKLITTRVWCFYRRVYETLHIMRPPNLNSNYINNKELVPTMANGLKSLWLCIKATSVVLFFVFFRRHFCTTSFHSFPLPPWAGLITLHCDDSDFPDYFLPRSFSALWVTLRRDSCLFWCLCFSPSAFALSLWELSHRLPVSPSVITTAVTSAQLFCLTIKNCFADNNTRFWLHFIYVHMSVLYMRGWAVT